MDIVEIFAGSSDVSPYEIYDALKRLQELLGIEIHPVKSPQNPEVPAILATHKVSGTKIELFQGPGGFLAYSTVEEGSDGEDSA